MSRLWTPEEDAIVRDTSLSLAEVAERTGRTYAAVSNRASLLGAHRGTPRPDRPWSQDIAAARDLEALDLLGHLGAVSTSQLADRLGCDKRAARFVLERLRDHGHAEPVGRGRVRVWVWRDVETLLAPLAKDGDPAAALALALLSERDGR